MKILGIESSCDETAAAVVESGARILSTVVASQIATHRPYGGVVPELASREHLRSIVPIVETALQEANTSLSGIDAIAVTRGPGLVGSLLVGLTYAKALALSTGKPLLGVNHLEGHIHAVLLQQRNDGRPEIEFPAVALVVSGGHTITYFVQRHGETDFHYEVVGRTRDDAAGEAFDKVAKLLALGYPGGPVIDRLARHGNRNAVRFTPPKVKGNALDFSFSGIKTAVLRHVQAHTMEDEIERRRRAIGGTHPPIEVYLELCSRETLDLVASFQEAVVADLVARTLAAAGERDVRSLVVTGGVACNSRLRERFGELPPEDRLPVYFPSPALSTDNAAMIAAAAYPRLLAGRRDSFDIPAEPALQLSSSTPVF